MEGWAAGRLEVKTGGHQGRLKEGRMEGAFHLDWGAGCELQRLGWLGKRGSALLRGTWGVARAWIAEPPSLGRPAGIKDAVPRPR